MFHPNQTFQFVIPGFENLPEDKRPSLTVRFGSAYEWLMVEERYSAARKLSSPEYVRAVCTMLSDFIRGASNMSSPDGTPVEYDADDPMWLAKVFGLGTLPNLTVDLPSAAVRAEGDLRKKYARQSPSEEGDSTAAAENAAPQTPALASHSA